MSERRVTKEQEIIWSIDYQLFGAKRAETLPKLRYHMRTARKKLAELESYLAGQMAVPQQPASPREARHD